MARPTLLSPKRIPHCMAKLKLIEEEKLKKLGDLMNESHCSCSALYECRNRSRGRSYGSGILKRLCAVERGNCRLMDGFHNRVFIAKKNEGADLDVKVSGTRLVKKLSAVKGTRTFKEETYATARYKKEYWGGN
ncbi:hypothetical protein V6N13_102153 [Hibiscus sabdariffa]